MITVEEKTLDDEVDDMKEKIEQLRFDVKQECEERRNQSSAIRIELGRLLLEKKEWEKLRGNAGEMENLESEINHTIGVRWWKPYTAGSFWSNLATPLNISISVLSLLTAGQAALSTIFTQETLSTMSFTVFVLSLINTFFMPHSRIADTISTMNGWRQFAHRFEKIYYTRRSSEEDIQRRSVEYRQLLIDMKDHMKESPDKRNLFEDMIYFMTRCRKKPDEWMALEIN